MNRKKKYQGAAAVLFTAAVIGLSGTGAAAVWPSGAGLVMAADEKKEIQEEESMVVLFPGPDTLADAQPEDLKPTSEAERDVTLKHCVDTCVRVNGEECYVYDTNVNQTHEWQNDYLPPLERTPVAYFDFSGSITVEVEVSSFPVETALVRPLSAGVEAEVDPSSGRVTFTLEQPGNYTVEFNGSVKRALHLFTNEPEQDIPDPEDKNVLYFGPGETVRGTINVHSGQTVYLAGGAVVYGTIKAVNAENVRICGRGILDGSKYSGWKGKTACIPLDISKCTDVEIEDLLLLNSNAWVCQALSSSDVKIDGLRIISARPNGDGITLQSCQNVEVSRAFVRSWDDSIVVKNYNENSSGITCTDCQIWTDLAQSMEIGFETNKGRQENASITNVEFRDMTVLHNFHKPVISIHNADDALVSGIRYENIVVEDAGMGAGDGAGMPYLVDLWITQNDQWSSTKERGQIRDIEISDVKVLSGSSVSSRIQGYDASHTVENVTISNVELPEGRVTEESGLFQMKYAENVIIQ